jgi:hypothetical protein
MLLGKHSTESPPYVYGAITRSGTAFQRTSTSMMISNSAQGRQPLHKCSHDPTHATPARYHTKVV